MLCLFKMTRQILKKPKETCWLPKWYVLNKERKILPNIQSVCYCFCFSCAFCFCFSNSFQARSKHRPQNSSTKNDKYIYIYIFWGGLFPVFPNSVLGHFWCGVAVVFISKYGIAVFRVEAVCGKFKFYAAVVGEKIFVSRWSASFSWQEDTNPKRSPWLACVTCVHSRGLYCANNADKSYGF